MMWSELRSGDMVEVPGDFTFLVLAVTDERITYVWLEGAPQLVGRTRAWSRPGNAQLLPNYRVINR